MSQITETICDQCGSRLKNGEKWLVAFEDEFQFSVRPNKTTSGKGWKDLCSLPCAVDGLEEFIQRLQRGPSEIEQIAEEFERRLP